MTTIVRKWGNSLAVRIPHSFAEDAQLKSGAEVNVSLHEGKIVLAPARRKRYRLATLLKGVTRGNRHAEVPSGGPVGKEIW
jgi:antitoxin MazE